MPLQHFRDALDQVSNQYFGDTERLFTYELYYQLKVAFTGTTILQNNIVIDAELPKRRLTQQQANQLGLLPLDRLMSPDIIIHERDTGNSQLLVAEVKTEKYLNAKKAINDINKLIALRGNYNFQIGIFVATNITMEKLRRHIHDPSIAILWPEMNGVRIVDPALNIHISTKRDRDSQWEHSTLISLINNPPQNP